MFDTSNKMTHLLLPLILSMLFLIPMVPVDGDGCYIPARPDIAISEPGQKAVIAWNGTHERMYLSVDIFAQEPTEGLHVVPFPTRPTVALGNVSVFENATEVFTGRVHEISRGSYGSDGSGNAGGGNSTTSIEIEFHDILGVHDLTVIKVKDVDGFKKEIESILVSLNISMESWPDGLDQVICNYTNRGFPYFAIDRFSVEPEEMSIDPIMYEFQTDRVIFPLEISSPLDGFSTIKLSIITPETIPLDLSGAEEYFSTIMEGRILSQEVEQIDPTLSDMFDSHCLGLFLMGKVDLSKLRGDLVLEPFRDASWMLVSDGMEVSTFTGEDGSDRSAMFLWSYRNDVTTGRLVSAETGNIIWEAKEMFRTDGERSYRNGVILEDLDDDGILDLIILELISGNQSVSRFDGEDGSLIWRTSLPMTLRNYHCTTTDEDGEVLLVIPSYYGIASIHLEDGSLTYNASLYDLFIRSIDAGRMEMISSSSGDVLILPNSRNDQITLLDPITLEVISSGYGYGYLDHFYHEGDHRELILCGRGGSFLLMDPHNGFIVEEFDSIDGRYVDHYHEDGDHFLIFLKDRRTAMKFDLTHKKIVWRTTFTKMEGDYGYLRLHTDDINDDDRLDIMLYYDHPNLDWSSYYSNADENSVYMVLLDGADGSPILTEHRRVLHPGLDLDGDGEREVLMDSPDEVQIVDPETGMVEMSFLKEHIDALVRCPIVEDLNDDGVEDIVLSIFTRNWYGYHGGSMADELIIIDGRLGEQTGVIEVTGSIRNIDVIDIGDEGNVILLKMEDQVLYFPMSGYLDLRAGSNIVDRGEGTTLILSARDGNDPMEGYQVTWTSTNEGDLFSSTQEWMPGLYMTRWTPSSDLIGDVEITAMIRSKDMLIHWETNITITVNGDVERILPGWLQFTAWLSPDDQVTLGNSTYAFISVQGIEGEELTISVEDIRGEGYVTGKSLVSRNVWAFRYWPQGEAGTRNLLIKVSHGDDLLFVDVLTLELIVPEVEEEVTSQPAEPPSVIKPRLELLRDTAYPGSMISLLVIFDLDLSSYQLESTDYDVGGFFTPFEPIIEGIWSCHYLVPDVEGSIPISVRVLDQNGAAWRLDDRILVVARPPGELPGPVEPSYSMLPLFPRQGDDRNIKVFLNDGLERVDISSFHLLKVPDGWAIRSIFLEEDGSLNLILSSEGTSGGQVELLLSDCLGRSGNLTIDLMGSLPINPQIATGGDILEGYEEGPSGPDDRSGSTVLTAILLLIVALFVGIVSLLVFGSYRPLDGGDKRGD